MDKFLFDYRHEFPSSNSKKEVFPVIGSLNSFSSGLCPCRLVVKGVPQHSNSIVKANFLAETRLKFNIQFH